MLNRENLLLLADRLSQLPADYSHFNMANYVTSKDSCFTEHPKSVTKKLLHTCGTVACAIGHAPTIRGLNARKDETWEDYSLRVFGLNYFGDGNWDFAFGSEWADHQDPRHHTAHAAAKRLRYLAEHGHGSEDYLDA